MDKRPLTPEGYNKLKERLLHLKSVVLPKIVKEIEVARAHGDLSENAEYIAAKEHQQHIIEEIRRIEDVLAHAEVIDTRGLEHDKVAFGALVELVDLESDERKVYKIVGTEESNIKEGKISIESPIGRALIGKRCGDIVEVVVPSGTRSFEVVNITYE